MITNYAAIHDGIIYGLGASAEAALADAQTSTGDQDASYDVLPMSRSLALAFNGENPPQPHNFEIVDGIARREGARERLSSILDASLRYQAHISDVEEMERKISKYAKAASGAWRDVQAQKAKDAKIVREIDRLKRQIAEIESHRAAIADRMPSLIRRYEIEHRRSEAARLAGRNLILEARRLGCAPGATYGQLRRARSGRPVFIGQNGAARLLHQAIDEAVFTR